LQRFDPGDPEIPRALRRLLRSARDADREFLAGAAVTYVFQYARTYAYRHPGSAPSPVDEFAQEVADLVANEMLMERLDIDGRQCYPVLQREIRKCLTKVTGQRTSVDAGAEQEIPVPQDKALARAWRLALRGISSQRYWRILHGQKHGIVNLRRALKRRIRDTKGLRLRRNSFFSRVETRSSDRRRPPLSFEDLTRDLTGHHRSLDRVVERLNEILHPDPPNPPGPAENPGHGGWANLWTLTTVLWELMVRDVEWGRGTQTRSPEARVDYDRLLRSWTRRAVNLRRSDIEKGLYPPGVDQVEEAYVLTAVEMALRAYGLGREENDGQAQAKVFCRMAGVSMDEYLSAHRKPLDYLIRRLRCSAS
jgi:hypothetical protein